MKNLIGLVSLLVLTSTEASAQIRVPQESFSWKYYRPTNTGIQGDWCDALWIAPDGNPWIGGYDPTWEEGGISKFIQAENRWFNVSNVDYPVIGHPDSTGTTRVGDIDVDATGGMWMATGRGGLYYNPAIGPSSLRRFGDDNSPIPGGWNKGVEVAPDGSVWFSSYSTNWGGGGIAKYTPSTNQWQVWTTEGYGGGELAIQPQPSGGYYVWTMSGVDTARFSSSTGTWTVLPKANGNPAYFRGKNLTDAAGNTWMYKWTNATLSEYKLDLRRPNGTWANIPAAPFDVPFNNAKCTRALGPNQAIFVDGGGTAFRFDGASWIDLGMWFNNVNTEDIDIDASGNIWVCGAQGAAKRDAATGIWQRYRITNTSQFGAFNNDLTIDPAGGIYACANAGTGYGGMVRFDGTRWIGYNDYEYGLGKSWPFPTDDSRHVYVRPSNGQLVVNPMFQGLHNYDGTNWFNYNMPSDEPADVIEDSQGRLWITYYAGLAVRTGSSWTDVSADFGGDIQRDPSRPGTVWAMNIGELIRTDGTNTARWSFYDMGFNGPSDSFHGFAVAPNGIVWVGADLTDTPGVPTVIRIDTNTGLARIYNAQNGMRSPGQTVTPRGVSPDGKVWMQYDSDFLTNERGLCWFDGKRSGVFPAPPGGEPQWGGLPHAAILDFEVKAIRSGYEIWMSCASRGIAVLTVRKKPGER
ncbi:MAG: hypothetical protein K8R88_09615 [Armatimonadetes bacterium]|nr:hypothetical protein [Armatimonadota bacterium]